MDSWQGLNLGLLWDADPTDQHSPNAEGMTGWTDDEDGIILTRPPVRVAATIIASGTDQHDRPTGFSNA